MRLRPYIQMMRPDHWFKNVFMVPGVLLAFYFRPALVRHIHWGLLLEGFAAACIVASSNYVLNEILDARRDRHHPDKQHRPLASGEASKVVAALLWVVLSVLGVLLGFLVNGPFGVSVATLWGMGLAYNVPPLRLKDIPYLDVVSEAVNNPIRLAMGWYLMGLAVMPPLSVVIAYWMFGAFLMAVKRFAEYRRIGHAERAGAYRDSFRYYTEERLQESIMFYAAFFAMMSGIFISRYCVRMVLATPVVAYCMAYYIHLGFKPNSPVQHPEHLLTEWKLTAVVLITFGVCAGLLFAEIPGFDRLFDPRILR